MTPPPPSPEEARPASHGVQDVTACPSPSRAHPDVQWVVLDVAVACRHHRTPETLEVSAVGPGGVKLKADDGRGGRLVFVKTSAPQALVRAFATAGNNEKAEVA